MEVEQLERIKLQIEKMSSAQQLEILKILHENENVKINENKSGVYVNLSFLPNNVVVQMQEYLKYVNDQENSLNVIENRKESVKHAYFEDSHA
jgi:hypothetical protein